jgi:hypothetical protein
MRTLLRIVSVLLGIVFCAFSVLMRYSRELISAGHWQIYFRFGHTAVTDWISLPLPVLMAFAAVSCFGLLLMRSVRQGVQNLLHDRRRLVWVGVVVFVWVLTMVPLDTASDPPYLTDQITYVSILFGALGVFYLLLGMGRLLEFAGRWAERGYELLLRIPSRALLVSCGAFVFIVANLISWLVFHHLPHIQDSVAQVFQARLFARGQLYAQSPPCPQFFDMPQIINNGRWYCQYPFGHPLLLVLGVFIGAPWIINPLLGALAVVVIYYVGRELYDEATARIGLVLATLSPFLLFMSSEFMSHSSALLVAALFVLFYARTMGLRGIRSAERGTPDILHSALPTPHSSLRTWLVPALLAGLCMGIVVDIRPYSGLLLVVPFALDAGWRLLRDWRRDWNRLAVMVGAGAVMVALLLIYNYLTNGSPLLFGYVVKWGPGHEVGFGHSGWGEPYTLARALVSNSIDLYTLNRHLFEFPIPSLLFIVVLFAAATRDRRDWLLLGTVVSLTIGYFFYWWHSILFGPRWQFEALPALVLLTARGMRVIPDYFSTGLEVPVPRERVRRNLALLLFVCYFFMLIVEMPARIQHYVRYGMGVRPETMKTVKASGVHNAIVFARRYEETFLQNSIPPGGDIVYARDLRGANPLITRQFPGRHCYLVNRDTMYEMNDMEFEHAPVKAGLDSIVQVLDRVDLSAYKTLFWPAEELKYLVEPAAGERGIPVVSYRELREKSSGDVSGLTDYLPAIGAWIVNDRSDGLAVFTYLDRQADQTIGPYEFRHLTTSANGTVTLFEIRRSRADRARQANP